MDNRLIRLSERLWYLPAHPDPSQVRPLIGVIIGDEETVLVDAGNSPSWARHLGVELERIQAPPVTRIIYTHHHWDHVFGACSFDAEVIAHAHCRTVLEKEVSKPWSRDFLEEEVVRDPRSRHMAEALKSGIEDWSGFRVVLPDVTFTSELTVTGEGYHLELEHVGGRHASDSITVMVRGESAMFLGDSFYPPPDRSDGSVVGVDEEMLRRFLAYDCSIYLDGHGKPFTGTELSEWLANSEGSRDG